MEEFSFDINSGLLTPEEAEKLFSEAPEENIGEPEPEEKEKKDNRAEEPDAPEEVGEENDNEISDDAAKPEGDGSSPASFYSSIAGALKDDGIFPDFSDDEIKAVKTPEDFAELFEKAVSARFDERQKRIDAALGDGVEPDKIRMYEQTISYLSSITDDAISAETDEGESLRKQLIYNDLLNKGYSKDRIQREIDKSFKSGSDIDDAKDALKELDKFYKDGYESLRNEGKTRAENARKSREKEAEDFRKMIIDNEISVGETRLDKRTRQKVFDAVVKPVYKDPDTGQLLTQVQKFQKENPLEFLKQLGMWYVLTDGGKSVEGLVKSQVRTERNKGIRELERKINSSALNSDGSLRYMSGTNVDNDSLLSDGWQVDL